MFVTPFQHEQGHVPDQSEEAGGASLICNRLPAWPVRLHKRSARFSGLKADGRWAFRERNSRRDSEGRFRMVRGWSARVPLVIDG